jgi:hypothetical protein
MDHTETVSGGRGVEVTVRLDVRPQRDDVPVVLVRTRVGEGRRPNDGSACGGSVPGDAQLERDVARAHAGRATRDTRDDRRGQQVDEHVPRVAQDDRVVAVETLALADGDRCFEGAQATSRSFSLSASARSFFRP